MNISIYRILFKTILLMFWIPSLLLSQYGNKYVHTATSSNIIGNWTEIDNSLLNGNPDAIFFITQNWNPSGSGGVYNPSPPGVWYNGSNWAIFNQDLVPMPEGAAFNVFIQSGSDDFVHTATGSNITSNWTEIDNSLLNGNPDAIFFITQNWNPSGSGGVYNPSPPGVWYNGSNWAIFNQDLLFMPEGAAFNVLIQSKGDDFVHTATASNITSNSTEIDKPELNGNPDAIFFITQNWNPSGGGGVYNPSPPGVWYNGSKWAIFNQDLVPMPEGADFNIYLAIVNVTAVEDRNDVLVERFQLEQNYPNPFNPSTTITYQVPVNSFVSVKVYDVLGKEVTSLVNEEKSAGSYNVNFNARELSSGIYLYTLQAGDFIETKKMILLR